MKAISIEKLAEVIGAEIINSASGEITGVSTNSRKIKTGDCFFAIKGENFDGHDYVSDALKAGAGCAVVERQVEVDGVVLKVNDSIEALGEFAKFYRKFLDYKVIGITGSAGKTTTRQMMHHVLSKFYKCYQSPGSFNNNIGVPITLLGANEDTEIVIAEIGSNAPGEISHLSKIAAPDIAIITNVYPAHLAGFGTLSNIIKEKASITEGLKPGGKLIINDKTLGLKECLDAIGIEYEIFDTDNADFKISVPGTGNLENAVAAREVAGRFNVNGEQFNQAIKNFKAAAMRMEILKIGKFCVINDCYNANPASMKNALGVIGEMDGRQVFVCGDMKELGEVSGEFHRQLGIDAAEAGVDVILACGEFANAVVEGAESAGLSDLQVECFDDASGVCNNLSKFVRDDDIILVKGSRSMHLEMVVEKLKEF